MPVESILRRWVGLWTAGEVEACIHDDSFVSQTGYNQICIYGMIVYNERNTELV